MGHIAQFRALNPRQKVRKARKKRFSGAREGCAGTGRSMEVVVAVIKCLFIHLLR